MAVEIDPVLVSPCSSDSASFVMLQHKMLHRFLMHWTSVTPDDVSQTKKRLLKESFNIAESNGPFQETLEKRVFVQSLWQPSAYILQSIL